jgi:hypothetical protein
MNGKGPIGGSRGRGAGFDQVKLVPQLNQEVLFFLEESAGFRPPVH